MTGWRLRGRTGSTGSTGLFLGFLMMVGMAWGAAWTVYAKEQAKFRLSYPANWRLTEWEQPPADEEKLFRADLPLIKLPGAKHILETAHPIGPVVRLDGPHGAEVTAMAIPLPALPAYQMSQALAKDRLGTSKDGRSALIHAQNGATALGIVIMKAPAGQFDQLNKTYFAEIAKRFEAR